jgi:hypothetical protein
MRILYLFALCLASAISPSAAGQSGKPAAPSTPAKNAPAQNVSVQPAATANGPAQAASQDATAQNPARQNTQADATTLGQAAPALSQAELERLLVQLQDAKSGKKYSLPQVPFDRGIYAARNALTGSSGSSGCYAIQSYNFSQGESPKLESITTCTNVVRPLMRQARKPESRNQQGQDNQQNQEKDQK